MNSLKIGYTSVFFAILVLLLKYYAYYVTGSIALYSDALESVVNFLTAVTMLFSLYLSQQPADKSHHFGHKKAEYFSALIESLFLLMAAYYIITESIEAFYHPRSFDEPLVGIFLNIIATLLNGFWGFYLYQQGKKRSSLALKADGVHLLVDVFTSCCVLAGLILSLILEQPLLDPIIAFLVGIHVIFAAIFVAKESIDGLMDASPPETIQEDIYKTILKSDLRIKNIHELRIRTSGATIFIEFHLVVDPLMTVVEAHEICNCIEDILLKKFKDIQTLIHVEPEGQLHEKCLAHVYEDLI